MSFLAMDPPQHGRMRGLVSRGFTPRRVADMEDGIRALTVTHLEACLAERRFDFVADLAGKVPMDVISEMLGVPVADRAELRRLSDLLVHREEGVTDVPPAGVEAAMELVVYYADLIAPGTYQVVIDAPDDASTKLWYWLGDGSRLLEARIDSGVLDGQQVAVATVTLDPELDFSFVATAEGDGLRTFSTVGRMDVRS